ncbi:MAG: dTDP-4-dehydrorhamnose reductase [Oceanospirillaceae bacterium]|nr:dTDP-4-dehydrorhamnose reductase [Oceanospirillaceae bacterium]
MYGDPVKVLVTGAEGQIGRAFVRLASDAENFEVVGYNHRQLDIADPAQIERRLAEELPHYVVNCAGFNSVDAAEANSALAMSVNADGADNLAKACAELSIPLLHISSDYIFDGHYDSGYTEKDEPAPLGVFGRSKLMGERHIRQQQPRHIILRVSWLFSETGRNYLTRVLEQAREHKVLRAVDDRRGCPTSSMDVARVLMAILQQLEAGAEAWGTYHYSGAEITTRYGFTEAIIAAASQYEELAVRKIQPIPSNEETGAERPTSAVLKCTHILNTFGIRQRPWRVDLQRLIREIYGQDGSKVVQPTVETRAEAMGS